MIARLQDWLALQAGRRPDAPAVIFRGRTASYGRIEQSSNRLARALRTAGCRAGDRVGLLLPKSTDAIVAMFAALKADCIYVPLDTASPAARLERILQHCECRCVLAEESSAALLDRLVRSPRWTPARIGWMDDGPALSGPRMGCFSRRDLDGLPDAPVSSSNDAAAPAHILFTSGSTGTPKGVVITHANVMQFVSWALRYFGTGPEDRISGHPPLYFDLSTFDIFGTVAAGAQLHLLPPETSILPHRLAAFIRDAQLTQWFSVPSVLQHLRSSDAVRENDFPALRRVLWCGEKLATPTLRYWMQRLPHVTFTNLYGPTEATIASSFYRVPVCPLSDDAEIPIGAPCDGESLLVLDESLHPVRRGQIGDLYIAGAGLSPGYWRDPARTAEVFLANPHSSMRAPRIYRTGDLARLGEDGMIYLLGRLDSQIKSRGYRIELGEVETAIQAVPGVEDAAVVAIESGDLEGKSICCAYVPSAAVDLPVAALKQEAARVLPRYMIPVSWMAVAAMPRNANGKTDRPLLRQWFRSRAEGGLIGSRGTTAAGIAVVQDQ
ncbi:MAG TPA: amino acid adenylation domain-containing protein [Bryobacteraceae bacterium]|nr:amino acid adenylation domain-containing protein [Bryobacteraceae bacterium]